MRLRAPTVSLAVPTSPQAHCAIARSAEGHPTSTSGLFTQATKVILGAKYQFWGIESTQYCDG